MKKLLCLVVEAMLLLNGYSQPTKYLNVGDTIPNILLSNIVNDRHTPARLHDIDKPIILDFFETHCGSCIALLPHLDNIQKRNKDSLSVYIVADESPEIIGKFLKTNTRAQNISLPFITNDTVLNNAFHFRSIPHEIWIGKDHVIKAITGYQYVNEENIQKLVNGDSLHLPLKDDYLKYKYDPQQPFDRYDQGSRLFFSSTLRGYMDNLRIYNHGSVLLSDSLHKKFYFTNSDLITALISLMGRDFTENKIQVLVKDSSKIIKPKDTKIEDLWFFDHSYCYELTVPRNLPDSTIRNYVLQDIGKSLGLDIRLVKKDMPCYIIIKNDKGKTDPATHGGKSAVSFYPKPGNPIFIHNQPLSRLLMAMNATDYSRKNQIVLDETGIKTNLDLELDVADVRDMQKMGEALQPYGFQIIRAVRPVRMLVISDL